METFLKKVENGDFYRPHSLGKLIEWKRPAVVITVGGAGDNQSPLAGETN